ncbi:MAG: toll/interleukin-1 receptor domain-containing protein, partial [Verrucomicrobiae bacterium]|nr:toll/interleukin-1 receptor domain-containing protein [Verrucomicrobiae bacterium]
MPPPTSSLYGYEIFFSYSRNDNRTPVNAEGQGWVSAFHADLKRRHRAYSGRELHIFFDTQAIDTGRDWRRELGRGIRESRLFLAFLSPNYLSSPNCLWEWEEYLRREHSAARGDDGLTPIYFVTPADLRPAADQQLAAWLA